jgi:hypothetical protein
LGQDGFCGNSADPRKNTLKNPVIEAGNDLMCKVVQRRVVLKLCGFNRCLQNMVTVRNFSAAAPAAIFSAGKMPVLRKLVTV